MKWFFVRLTFLALLVSGIFFILIMLAKGGHSSEFLFHSYQYIGDYSGDLYMYDVDHHFQVRLTAPGGWFHDNSNRAVISPDYQFTAVSRSSGTLSMFGLIRTQWAKQVNTDLEAQLIFGMLPLLWNDAITNWGNAAWSPKIDGGVMHLAFTTNNAPDIDFHEWRYNNIWVADISQRRWQQSDVMLPQQGGFFPPLADTIRDTRHRLTNTNANDDDMAWSPDGSQMAFVSDRDGSPDIYLLDTDGVNKNVRRITHSLAAESSPSWSRDGKWLVFASEQEKHSQLYIVSTSGGEPRQLTWDSFKDIRPSWSPDGRTIVYLSDDFITLIHPDGSGMQRLFKGINPVWLPN